MRRVYLCFGILIILVGTSIVMLLTIKGMNNKIADKVNLAIENYNAGDKETNIAVVDDINSSWEQYQNHIVYFISNDRLEYINVAVAKLKPFLDNDNTEFLAECYNIKHALDFLYGNQKPSLRNIL